MLQIPIPANITTARTPYTNHEWRQTRLRLSR